MGLILDRVLLKIYSWVIGRGREIQCGPFDEDLRVDICDWFTAVRFFDAGLDGQIDR